MNQKNRKIIIIVSGIAVGLLVGYLYWRFVGCSSGSCGITAHWYSSTAVGGILGYLLSDIIASKVKGENK